LLTDTEAAFDRLVDAEAAGVWETVLVPELLGEAEADGV